MKRIALFVPVVLAMALLVHAAPLEAEGKGKRKKQFEEIGKLLKSGDSSALVKLLAKARKIDLRLHGVKEGKYRLKQAKSLLLSFFKAVEMKELKPVDGKGSTRRFKVKYRVKANGKSVEATLHVTLVLEEKSWRIGGILES